MHRWKLFDVMKKVWSLCVQVEVRTPKLLSALVQEDGKIWPSEFTMKPLLSASTEGSLSREP